MNQIQLVHWLSLSLVVLIKITFLPHPYWSAFPPQNLLNFIRINWLEIGMYNQFKAINKVWRIFFMQLGEYHFYCSINFGERDHLWLSNFYIDKKLFYGFIFLHVRRIMKLCSRVYHSSSLNVLSERSSVEIKIRWLGSLM